MYSCMYKHKRYNTTSDKKALLTLTQEKILCEICIVYPRLTMPQFNLLVLYLYCDIFLFHFVFYRSQGPPQYGNIMYDRRIVRGNTYAQHTLPAVRTSSFISMILLLS